MAAGSGMTGRHTCGLNRIAALSTTPHDSETTGDTMLAARERENPAASPVSTARAEAAPA